MKIAFLILCHKNPNQINLLIEKLTKVFDCDIYIHIDRKNYNLIDKIKKNDNLYILPIENSFIIKWGGMNMVYATLELIKLVKKQNINYDYLWLLSGQDFLINSKKEVEKKLNANKGNNYIEIIPKNCKKYYKYRKLYEIPYPCWMSNNKILCKILKRMYMIVTGGFSNTFNYFKRIKPFNFDFEFGSQWWTLTAECAYYILDYCNKNPEYLKYFEKTLIPDECFFQTIFMSSRYKCNRLNNLTYVNWGKNRRSPETFTLKDYNLLEEKSKEYIFARKFDINIDSNIVKKLNQTNL